MRGYLPSHTKTSNVSTDDILIVGGNRGLGEALANIYVGEHKTVYATARHSAPHDRRGINWIPNIDITHENAGRLISMQYNSSQIDLLVICAGYFAKEKLDALNYEKELLMYKTTAIGPTFLVQNLVSHGLLKEGARIVLVGGESGSVALRHAIAHGGNYGGHGSKAALNMTAKLLSIDLEKKGIAVSVVHTGYLRKQNPDGFFEKGGPDGKHRSQIYQTSKLICCVAVKPDEAAHSLRDWIADFDMSKTGQFWSVRGTAGIPSAEHIMGKQTAATEAVQLPW